MKLLALLLLILIASGCVAGNTGTPQQEGTNETFIAGNFSMAHPEWPELDPADGVFLVERAGCHVKVKSEDFAYLPGAFKLRTHVIEMALQSINLTTTQEEVTDRYSIIDYSMDTSIHGKVKLVPCDGRIYWVLVGCPVGGDDSFFAPVLESASCSALQVVQPEECPVVDIGLDTRSFSLVTTSNAAYMNDRSWLLAMERVPQVADVLLWQIIPKWEEFLPGRTVSANVSNEATIIRTYADIQGLDLYVGLDPTAGINRSELYTLAPGRRTRFLDPDFREAFKNAALYYTRQMKPKYLALGIEINMYYLGNEDDFANYISLYKQTYDAVKGVSPDTKVFATIQLEDIQGLWSWNKHEPPWFIVKELEPKMDLLVLSTYPSLLFDSPREMPADYLSRVRDYTGLKIAIGETGYNSGKGLIKDAGSQEKQKEYLMRMLREADELDMEFFTWYTIYDAEDLPRELEPFKDMGLRYSDDTMKPVWCAMRAAKGLPRT